MLSVISCFILHTTAYYYKCILNFGKSEYNNIIILHLRKLQLFFHIMYNIYCILYYDFCLNVWLFRIDKSILTSRPGYSGAIKSRKHDCPAPVTWPACSYTSLFIVLLYINMYWLRCKIKFCFLKKKKFVSLIQRWYLLK